MLTSSGSYLIEPGTVEGSPESGSIPQGGAPQRQCLLALASGGEAPGLQARGDERLQARHAWVGDTRLPSLDGGDVHADPRRQLTLGQAGPTAQT
jgi:hypothetical protein